ncbi:pyruvate kinase [Kosmotoga arenicorallina S304]|uniref:Pyruvate kinase n=1 Tax=Kosmotoga arenicorallina S304 TaxID=1453497 RepID=A0A176K244_9BACT|nr:pyruvate kinase [Kosmotoga arenicorallina]OAA31079.1 pyruvate kinase [Kosmotoga arenicorallina S304]
MRKTKIVCTIGPATESPEMIKKLILAGMNVARLNTSHDTPDHHRERIRTIKRIRDELGIPVAILLDLSGPKLRTGTFNNDNVSLHKGQKFSLTTENIIGDSNGVSVNYPLLPREVNPGDIILLNDGKVKLKVLDTSEKSITTEVLNDAEITHHRGINVPGIDLSINAVTKKDEVYIKLGVEEGVDYFALSFVRKPEDVKKAREIINSHGSNIPVVSKIETSQALSKITEISEVSDGLMVARGDLGVEIPVEEVPIAQKKIIKAGNRHRIPVITATQMLESMIENPTPTRAEATDISNAILDGTDAIMLSAETSIGNYPIEAVCVMNKTAISTERYLQENPHILHWTRRDADADDHTDAICRAAWDISESLKVKLIVSSTYSGHTAINVSGFRPRSTILAVTPNRRTYYQLSLVWGVLPLYQKIGSSIDEMVEIAGKKAREMELIKGGDHFIITAGVPLGVAHSTNMLKLEKA